jgi:tetratricopeptide (TPR) repeat protein
MASIFYDEIKNTRFLLTLLSVLLLALFGAAIELLIFWVPQEKIPDGLMGLLTTLVGASIAIVSVAFNSYFKGREQGDALGLGAPGNEAEKHNKEGFELYLKGKYDEAIVAFDKAIELNGNFAIAYNNKGQALLKKEKFNEAVDAFRAALGLDPSLILAQAGRDEAQSKIKGIKPEAVTLPKPTE